MNKNLKKAIYPLSADPLTNGHIDIINRATKIFDEVVVAVGNNFSKNYLFNLEERLEIVNTVLKDRENVKVVGFDGLLTDIAMQEGINFIVRGFRNSNDYLHELTLFQNYSSQSSNLEFINLFSSKEYISSTAVKETAKFYGDLHDQVPLVVKSALEKKLHDQTFIAVTGEIGSMKSELIQKLVEFLNNKKIRACSIDFDELGHLVLKNNQRVRERICYEFNLKKDFTRSDLAKVVFGVKDNLNKLNKITHPEIFRLFREKVKNLKGLIILEIPLLAEENLSYLSNNQVILTKIEKGVQRSILSARGYSDQQISGRLDSQFSFQQKKKVISEKISQDGIGNLFEVNPNQDNLNELFTKIVKYLKLEN
jgi:pantetheine-phosphate adenylyltransferase